MLNDGTVLHACFAKGALRLMPRHTAAIERDVEFVEDGIYDDYTCKGVVGSLIGVVAVECDGQIWKDITELAAAACLAVDSACEGLAGSL